MPRPLRYPRQVKVFFDETQFEILKENAASIGIKPADLVRGWVEEGLARTQRDLMFIFGELLELAHDNPELVKALKEKK